MFLVFLSLLSTSYGPGIFSVFNSQQPFEIGIVVLSILWMRKWKLVITVKPLIRGRTWI
jgi:hypothetical protein